MSLWNLQYFNVGNGSPANISLVYHKDSLRMFICMHTFPEKNIPTQLSAEQLRTHGIGADIDGRESVCQNPRGA